VRRDLPAVAVVAVFVAFGTCWGAWSAVLPEVQQRTGTTNSSLGAALLAVGVGALLAMGPAGRAVDRHPRATLPPLAALLGLAFLLPGAARGLPTLALGLLVLGAVSGSTDVVMNTVASGVSERRVAAGGTSVLPGAHAGYSGGFVLGALAAGGLRTAGLTAPSVLALAALGTLAAAALAWVRPEPSVGGVAAAPVPASARGRLVRLGLLVGAAFAVEDAAQSWTSVHLTRDLHASPALAGAGAATFASAALAGRLAQQVLGRRVAPARQVRVGELVAAGGLVLLALAPSGAFVLVGAAVVGVGVSACAPVVFAAAAASVPPGARGSAVAGATRYGYLGFTLGPVLVGALAGLLTLPAALALLALLAVAVAAGARTVQPPR